MKTKTLLFAIALIFMLSAFGQKPTLELTFTAIDSAAYVQLDSIKVMNLTQEGDTVLYWPDTVLVLDYLVGITEIHNGAEKLQVFQNYPNPVKDQTTLTLYLPEEGNVNLVITDILGRQVINTEKMLERGFHSFRFTPGSGKIFFFTAYWKSASSSIKILTAGNVSGLTNSLDYVGSNDTEAEFKSTKDIQDFSFSLGDELLYIGYFDTLQSGMLDAPEVSDTFVFQFATNIPCPGIPTVEYEGQVYNTIQICGQCWLKENLNVGTMIQETQQMTDNELIEKYCYNNEEDSCNIYGGLYQWNEMMQYIEAQGAQGICPPGWHVPTDYEWKILEGTVDSQYGIGDNEWNGGTDRGFDAGKKLKSTYGWLYNNNGTDTFGFTGLSAGFCYGGSGGFSWISWHAYIWSSSVNDTSGYYRMLAHMLNTIRRRSSSVNGGMSVRCIKD